MTENILNINSGPLFICDMRPGFTEDGVEISLPKGMYVLTTIKTGDLQGFELILDGKHADREEEFSKLSLDGSCVGVFDKNGFLKHFNQDFESLYEWSSNIAISGNNWKDISHENAGLAFYVKTFTDCSCNIAKLYSNNAVVGLKVLPIETERNEDQERTWTWVSFKCEGLYQEFNVCHDRDYEIVLEEVVEDILTDFCTVETETGLDFLDENEVNLKKPITSYRNGFRGIKSISVYYERSSGGENIRQSIYPDISNLLEAIDSKSSTRDLAECIYNIFKLAEKMS